MNNRNQLESSKKASHNSIQEKWEAFILCNFIESLYYKRYRTEQYSWAAKTYNKKRGAPEAIPQTAASHIPTIPFILELIIPKLIPMTVKANAA